MNMELTDDSKLVDSFLKGDESALAELIERYKNKVFGFIFSKVLDKNIA